LLWPLIGNLTRLVIGALVGWLALRWSGNLSHVFLAQSLALVAFGLINASRSRAARGSGRSPGPGAARPPCKGDLFTTNPPDRAPPEGAEASELT